MGKSPRPNYHEDRMARALDQLAEYDSFTSEIAPLLRKAIKEGWSAERLKTDPRIKTLLLARQISIGLMEKNSAAALSAIKDLIDRSEGKPVERKDIKMSLEAAPDEEIDAKLKQLLNSTDSVDSDTVQ